MLHTYENKIHPQQAIDQLQQNRLQLKQVISRFKKVSVHLLPVIIAATISQIINKLSAIKLWLPAIDNHLIILSNF